MRREDYPVQKRRKKGKRRENEAKHREAKHRASRKREKSETMNRNTSLSEKVESK